MALRSLICINAAGNRLPVRARPSRIARQLFPDDKTFCNSSINLTYRKVKSGVSRISVQPEAGCVRVLDEESDMISSTMIVAFLSIPTFLSFAALIRMSQMQESVASCSRRRP